MDNLGVYRAFSSGFRDREHVRDDLLMRLVELVLCHCLRPERTVLACDWDRWAVGSRCLCAPSAPSNPEFPAFASWYPNVHFWKCLGARKPGLSVPRARPWEGNQCAEGTPPSRTDCTHQRHVQ